MIAVGRVAILSTSVAGPTSTTYVGSTLVTVAYVGSTAVTAVYVGTTRVL